MISAPYLEVAVLVLGAIILLVESFASQLDRRFLAYAALCGLGVIFLATFFVAPQSSVGVGSVLEFLFCRRTLTFF